MRTGFFLLFFTPILLPQNTLSAEYITATGRVFVTLFGYPSRCEHRGLSHACTLAVACWLVGGQSESGCGASSWLVSCCVTSAALRSHPPPQSPPLLQPPSSPQTLIKPQMLHRYEVDEYQALDSNINGNGVAVLQRRNDEIRIEEECGVSADRVLQKRIIGGHEARFAQFPWQAHLRITAYQCGGVLVSRRFVATAAHCIIRAKLKDITVYLGELDTQDTGKVVELAPAEFHRVKQKIIHPKFQFRSTQPDRYDLALLLLSTTAGHAFHIAPVCLPESGINLRGRSGVVAGWGKIKPSTELTGTNVLRSATVPILDIMECMAWHQTKQISVELHEEMMCAGHEDGSQDACLGDSGGPLIVLVNGKWTLAGITSAGFGCGEPHQPGIYHDVSVTADWIRKVIKDFGYK